LFERSPREEAIQRVVDEFVTRRLDSSIREEVLAFVRPIVSAARPPTLASAKNLVRDGSGLAAWCLSVGIDLDPRMVFAPSTFERYLAIGLADTSEAVRKAARSNLRRLAKCAAPKLQPPEPSPISRSALKRPYDLDQVEAFLRLAEQQQTQLRRDRLTSLICMGAGAGLMPGEFQNVQARDVARRGRTVLLNIAGANARVLPVLEPLGQLLRGAAGHLVSDAYLLGGTVETDRRNQVALTIAHMYSDRALPRLDIGRLRATWLTHQLEVFGFDVLLAASGLRQSSLFCDLVALFPKPSEEVICQQLRGRLL
jgi:integrase